MFTWQHPSIVQDISIRKVLEFFDGFQIDERLSPKIPEPFHLLTSHIFITTKFGIRKFIIENENMEKRTFDAKKIVN